MRPSGKHLDKYRQTHPNLGLSPPGTLWGYFRFRRPPLTINLISSGEQHHDTAGMGDWEHVSVSIERRQECPDWALMCEIKNMFWRKDETVIQIHPPESDYVSFHPYCLHLWKPPYALELPPTFALGPVTGQQI